MTQTLSQPLADTLTAQDLKGFDRRRVALLREMEEHGWRGRRTANKHIVMRAPDGRTTTCVSPKVISKNDQYNVARDYRSWLRRQEQAAQEPRPVIHDVAVIIHSDEPFTADLPAPVRPAHEPVPAPVDTASEPEPEAHCAPGQACDDCGREFATLQALSVHHVRAHVKAACPVCDRELSPGNLPRHLRKHADDLGTHEEVMREVFRLRAELARVRTDATEWERIADEIEDRYTAIKNRLDNAVGYLLGDS